MMLHKLKTQEMFAGLAKTKLLLVAVITAIFLFSCSTDGGSSSTSSNSDDPVAMTGQSTQTFTHGGVERTYILYIPSSYDGTTAVPLMFNFHGFGGDVLGEEGGKAEGYIDSADMRPVAVANNFILVYPQGTELDGSTHWNAALPGGDNKSSADDLGFIEALIAHLSSEYMIDATRVYAVGYSNGGMFSYALACYKSSIIAAIGSVSGAMLDIDNTSCTPSHPLAVIIMHGTNDGVIDYDGSGDYNSVQQAINFWTTYNVTTTTNSDTSNSSFEHDQYTGGTAGVTVEHYKVVNGGHVWFDTDFNGSNTGEVLWNFLSRYNTSGLITNP